MAAKIPIEKAKKRAAWSILMGVLTAALGTILIVYPLVTAKVTSVIVGWVLIFVAAAQFIFALHSPQPRSFLLKLLGAAAFAIVGAALVFAPMASVEALTGLLGTLLLVQAGLATVTAFQIRPLAGWPWYLLEATISFALGLLILVTWPFSSVWAIGVLVGVAVFTAGIVRIVVAIKVRREERSMEPFSPSSASVNSEQRSRCSAS